LTPRISIGVSKPTVAGTTVAVDAAETSFIASS
jgi:hypothetical protein